MRIEAALLELALSNNRENINPNVDNSLSHLSVRKCLRSLLDPTDQTVILHHSLVDVTVDNQRWTHLRLIP
jgi:hypothetical protein